MPREKTRQVMPEQNPVYSATRCYYRNSAQTYTGSNGPSAAIFVVSVCCLIWTVGCSSLRSEEAMLSVETRRSTSLACIYSIPCTTYNIELFFFYLPPIIGLTQIGGHTAGYISLLHSTSGALYIYRDYTSAHSFYARRAKHFSGSVAVNVATLSKKH